MKRIDLRSDTVTVACQEMRQAMAQAEVGDAVMGEDPTVKQLEQDLAAFFGFRHAAFVPSGTMSNQLLLRCQSEPGDAIMACPGNHIFCYESGAAAALAGLQLLPAPLVEGTPYAGIDAARLAALFPSEGEFYKPPVAIVALENTNMDGAGAIYPAEAIAELGEVCRQLGTKLHMDGARIWHALLDPLVREARWLGAACDSLSVCLSKGLGAPVGSMALINDGQAFLRLRRFQRMYGGFMRQAGHLAAAGLYALHHNLPKLPQTHVWASRFADFCRRQFPGAHVHYGGTNIVILEGTEAKNYKAILEREHNCLLSHLGADRIRAVFHIDVDGAALDRIVGSI